MIDPADITVESKAVTITAGMRLGEPEFIEHATPRDALMAREAPDEGADRSSPIADVMGFLFADSPHPARVILRLYCLTNELAPEFLRTLPREELRALVKAGEHLFRVSVVLRGTRVAGRRPRAHDKVINRILAAAYWRQKAKTHPPRIDLHTYLRVRPQETVTGYKERMAASAAVLRFFFFDGPQPELTVIRVYALAKSYHSELLCDMSVRQLGALFGVEGATWSERIKQKLNRFLKDRGAAGVMARFQKSQGACESYAQAQQGNNNRRGGEPRCA